MQQLLRGRLLYLCLGGLIIFLYLRGLPLIPTEQTVAPSAPPSSVDAMTWWPEDLDVDALRAVGVQSPQTMAVLSVLLLFIVGMTLGGIGLNLWALWSGRIRSIWRFGARTLPRWSWGELVRIILLTVMIASLAPFVRLTVHAYQPTWDVDPHAWITMSMLFLDLFVILAILTFAVEKGGSLRSLFGFSGRTAMESIETGFRGYIAVFPWLFLLLFLILEAARFFKLQPPMEPIHQLIFEEQRPAVLGLTMLLACLVGPLAEELFFRGVLYPVIRRRVSRLLAVLINGAVFSLIHTNFLGFVSIMALGCLLAYLYERTGTILSPLAVHVLHNTFLMSLAMAFRSVLALRNGG